jgi:[ribosomal protein S5]-alanine N-acetyltransferase
VQIEPIRTARMTLRSIESGDRAEFVRVHEASAELYAPWLPALGPGETWHDAFEQSLAKTAQENYLRLLGILPDGRIAGMFSLGEIVRGFFQCAYAGWQVSAEVAGQGYATEGVRGLLDLAFDPEHGLGLHRVQANIIPTNLRSLRVAQRVGFRSEGRALKYLKIAGVWQDHLMFAKVSGDRAIP